MADEKLHEADELRNEKDKREDNESQERMTKNFADDVAIQDAHEANAKCSMAHRLPRLRCAR
jgi:hypothetical protein